MPKFKPRQDRIRETKNLVAGLRKRFAPKDVVVLGGRSMTRAEVETLLEQQIALEEGVDHTHVVWLQALADAEAFARKNHETFSLLRRWLHVTYGGCPDLLGEFGLAPHKKPRALTVEEKKAVAEKILATRTARHTMGSKQRAKIKGMVDPPDVAHAEAAAEE